MNNGRKDMYEKRDSLLAWCLRLNGDSLRNPLICELNRRLIEIDNFVWLSHLERQATKPINPVVPHIHTPILFVFDVAAEGIAKTDQILFQQDKKEVERTDRGNKLSTEKAAAVNLLRFPY